MKTTEPAKSADSTSATVQDSSLTTRNTSIEMQSFCARIMNFCDYVTGANQLTDIVGLKKVAEDLKREALGVSKTFYKL